MTDVRIVEDVTDRPAGEFISDCNDPSAPPVFLSADPSHQTHLLGEL